MKIKTNIKDGQIDLDLFEIEKWSRKQEDGDYKLEITKSYKTRSLNENSYYWGVIVKILSDELGYTAEEMHYSLKEKFIGSWEDDNGLKVMKETKGMDTKTFEDYCSNIRRWASTDLSIFIPLPNESIDV